MMHRNAHQVELEKLKAVAPKSTVPVHGSEMKEKKGEGMMADLPEPMVKGLSDELKAQIAEAVSPNVLVH